MLNIDIDRIRQRLVWYQYYKVEDVTRRVLRTVSYTAMIVVWAFIFSGDTMRRKIMERTSNCDFYGREFDRSLLTSLMNAYAMRNTLDEVCVTQTSFQHIPHSFPGSFSDEPSLIGFIEGDIDVIVLGCQTKHLAQPLIRRHSQ